MTGCAGPDRTIWERLRQRVGRYLANDDPLAAAANQGAFLVWSSQPFYPIYVWLLVGRDAWPSLLTWLSTPFFFAVPLVCRSHALAGRALFVVTGVGNTLLTAKAFGPCSAVGWFLVPCLVLSLGFFRAREWKTAAALTLLAGCAAGLVDRLGTSLGAYSEAQTGSLARLNVWSVGVLSAYLIYLAADVRRRNRKV